MTMRAGLIPRADPFRQLSVHSVRSVIHLGFQPTWRINPPTARRSRRTPPGLTARANETRAMAIVAIARVRARQYSGGYRSSRCAGYGFFGPSAPDTAPD